MNNEIRMLWARTIPVIWPECYMLVSVPLAALRSAAEAICQSADRYAALVVERDEVSLTIEQNLWEFQKKSIAFVKAEGPYRVISLSLNLDLGVCGYFAPAAALLAEAKIPIVPQSAFLKDHILIRDADAAKALDILNQWVKSCADVG
jgi:hypothetical protein